MAPSIWQLLIVLVIVALLFGTKKLKNIGGDLGGAIKGFKNAISDDKKNKDNDDTKVEEQPESDIDAQSSPETDKK